MINPVDLTDHDSGSVRKWLQAPETHQDWIHTHYSKENMKFHELAINHIVETIRPKQNSLFLDAGCGDCTHSIQLATRGFTVQAVDISQAAVNIARINVKASKLDNKIRIESGNLCELSFENETFDNILCWGVLIHIPSPELEKAMSEMARVLRHGGALIVSVGNTTSFWSLFGRYMVRLLRRKRTKVEKTPAGIEYWTIKASGISFVRDHNIKWLVRKFEEYGLAVQERTSAEFTIVWTMIHFRRLQNLILKFNRFWFKYVRFPYFADGNIIIFRKV